MTSMDGWSNVLTSVDVLTMKEMSCMCIYTINSVHTLNIYQTIILLILIFWPWTALQCKVVKMILNIIHNSNSAGTVKHYLLLYFFTFKSIMPRISGFSLTTCVLWYLNGDNYKCNYILYRHSHDILVHI